MNSSPKRPADDEIMLLSPSTLRKAPGSRSPVPSENITEQKEAGSPIKTKRDKFWKAWEVYRHRPWNMCVLVVVGTLFAIGHHLFYLNLDGKEADDQSLMLRYGTVIAFCAKASLGTAVALSFYQKAWQVVRYKMARLETVDSIFTANSDVFSLLTWSSIKKAKIGTLLALYCWLTPLVVVLTSDTLSVIVGVKEEQQALCPSARTLNFENEEIVYWREATKFRINGYYEASVSLWNSTVPGGEDPGTPTSTKFDYYTDSSQQYDGRILTIPALTGEAAVRKEWASEVCAEGWNCSYVVDFVAPGYKCEELASGVGSKVKKLGDAIAPFNTSAIAPMGNLTYYAITDRGDYENLQMVTEPPGIPKAKPPYPNNFAAFRTEPIVWIGYATVDDYSVPQPGMPHEGNWYKAYTPVIIGCEHYEVNYTVKFEFIRGAQSYEVKHRDYLRKVINTTYIPQQDPDKRLKDRTQAVPETNYVLPQDVRKYRRTAAYHAIGSGLRKYLNGTTTMPNFNVNSLILRTHLLETLNYLPIKNFKQGIRKLYEDMLISFFAEPTFSVVSWAVNGKPSGNIEGGPSTAYPCHRQRITTFFKYNMTQLLTVYAVSIFLAVIGVLLGLQAYREEGAMRDMKPSSIIEASRASNLHGLGQGKDVRIGYGLVQEEAGRSVRSFGVEGNVELERRASGV
ncbi:hypothetical protein F53441_3546 [Fusarium austroafricanum]|uniref:Uncharacterized protein n=1 Tax=Fusarium austroafricanum TaxID=2364996 RepID=A0A8H4KPK5_9HYPO|nr:hypothetical protein F53441_3546 [Fusarium austroafricanum]